jgi:hypothetical protein
VGVTVAQCFELKRVTQITSNPTTTQVPDIYCSSSRRVLIASQMLLPTFLRSPVSVLGSLWATPTDVVVERRRPRRVIRPPAGVVGISRDLLDRR